MLNVQGYCTELACWQRAEECLLHTSPLYLSQRPAYVTDAIEAVFHSYIPWDLYFSGQKNYGLGGLNEYKLAMALIKEFCSVQKKFVFLDIGSGKEFKWGRGLIEYLKQVGLPAGVSVSVISVTGEITYPEVTKDKDSPCTLYELGAFMIEDLASQLHNRVPAEVLENGIDMIVSRWTFRHLADPVGTFEKTINFLRPGTGWFLGDGFFHLRKGEENLDSVEDPNRRMIQLLSDTNLSFLVRPWDGLKSLYQFILQRTNNHPCRLPMSYRDVVRLRPIEAGNWKVASGRVTQFDRTPQPEDSTELFDFDDFSDYLQGDKCLYQWLHERNLWDNRPPKWTPLYERERNKSPMI